MISKSVIIPEFLLLMARRGCFTFNFPFSTFNYIEIRRKPLHTMMQKLCG